MKLSHYFLFLSMIGFLVTGCAGVQEAIDIKLLEGVKGKKYAELTGGTSGFSYSSTRPDWPTGPMPPPTGAPPATPFWPTSRLWRVATVSGAGHP